MSELLFNITKIFLLVIIVFALVRIDKNVALMRKDTIRVSQDTMVLMEWDSEIIKMKNRKCNKENKK